MSDNVHHIHDKPITVALSLELVLTREESLVIIKSNANGMNRTLVDNAHAWAKRVLLEEIDKVLGEAKNGDADPVSPDNTP